MDEFTLLKTKKAPRKGGALFHIEIRERYLFQCSCLVEATELPLLWIILLIVGCNLGPPLDCSVPIRTRQPPTLPGSFLLIVSLFSLCPLGRIPA